MSGFFRAEEEPVFRAEFDGAYDVFDEVVVDLKSSVYEVVQHTAHSRRGGKRELELEPPPAVVESVLCVPSTGMW